MEIFRRQAKMSGHSLVVDKPPSSALLLRWT